MLAYARAPAQQHETGQRSAHLPRSEIVQRPTAEGGEAGAEDEPRVDEIGVGDDAFLEHALRFHEIRVDQLVDELLAVAVRLALDGFAVFPAVDALPGLPAELAELDLAGEYLRHGNRSSRERLAGGEADV